MKPIKQGNSYLELYEREGAVIIGEAVLIPEVANNFTVGLLKGALNVKLTSKHKFKTVMFSYFS